MKKIISVLFVSLLINFNLIAQEKPQSLPKFAVQDTDGNAFSEKDLAHNKYIVFVYFSPTCPHCQRAFKTLNENVAKLDNNMAVYGVTMSDKGNSLFFMKKYAPALNEISNYKLLMDKDGAFATVFGVERYPSIYLYSPDKKLLSFEQDEKKVLNFLEKIKPVDR